jgi:hypothetical protein
MNIYAESGAKVRCVSLTAGYECDQKRAREYLELNQIYTVDYTEVYNWCTDVYLREFPMIAFNSVIFEDVEGDDK